MSERIQAARYIMWGMLLGSVSAIYLLAPLFHLDFDWTGSEPLAMTAGIFLASAFYCRKRDMTAFAVSLETAGVFICLILPVMMSTYLAASLAYPMADGVLARWDGMLGFEWAAVVRAVDSSPVAASLLNYAYSSFGVQLLLLPFILGFSGRHERAYTMIAAYAVLCFASSVISTWYPSLGNHVINGIAPQDLENLSPHFGYAFLEDFKAVRAHEYFVLSIENASGIVTFPSVHAAVALLCAWAAWDVTAVRYPFLVANVLMAASAVTNGSHYLVDVLAGLAVAVLSLIAVRFAVTQLAARTGRAASQPAWLGIGPKTARSPVSGNT